MTFAMEMISIVVVGTALFIFPGYALLVLFGLGKDYNLSELLCVASGLSIAVVPILLYVATLLGLRFTPLGELTVLAIAGVVSAWNARRRCLQWFRHKSTQIDWVYFALGIIFVTTLAARILMVSGIAYPLWTDSYHHTLIAQLIADQGNIPTSYAPYLPIDRFTYHFGFHTLVAWFSGLSGIAIPRSVVLVGQIINALAVPTAFFFTSRLFHDRSAGLVAAMALGRIF